MKERQSTSFNGVALAFAAADICQPASDLARHQEEKNW
jgi:hypothetical protein